MAKHTCMMKEVKATPKSHNDSPPAGDFLLYSSYSMYWEHCRDTVFYNIGLSKKKSFYFCLGTPYKRNKKHIVALIDDVQNALKLPLHQRLKTYSTKSENIIFVSVPNSSFWGNTVWHSLLTAMMRDGRKYKGNLNSKEWLSKCKYLGQTPVAFKSFVEGERLDYNILNFQGWVSHFRKGGPGCIE